MHNIWNYEYLSVLYIVDSCGELETKATETF